MKTEIDHKEYREKVRWMTSDQLKWTIEDCREAIKGMPQGPKVGYYLDEINYCSMELSKRKG
jgi:hypothetical protein